jgi:molybdopterin/thiamine biosynthesis adenylyltransferase
MENLKRRYEDADFMKKQLNIILGGAGGIGSYTAYFLSHLNHNLTIYDIDVVEQENIGTQFHALNLIGATKTAAIQSLIANIKGDSFIDNIITFHEKITEEDPLKYIFDVYISAFDNMKARKAMLHHFKEALEINPNAILIDGRLLAENFQIFTVTQETVELYETEFMFDDSEVEDQPCTYKATSHFGGMIGSYITNLVCNYAINLNENQIIRRLPFFIEYNGFITLFTVKDYEYFRETN